MFYLNQSCFWKHHAVGSSHKVPEHCQLFRGTQHRQQAVYQAEGRLQGIMRKRTKSIQTENRALLEEVKYPEISLGPVHISLGYKIIQSDHEDHGLEDVVQKAVQVEVTHRVVGDSHDQTNAEKN